MSKPDLSTKADVLRWADGVCCTAPANCCGDPRCFDARETAAYIAECVRLRKALAFAEQQAAATGVPYSDTVSIRWLRDAMKGGAE